MNAFAAAEEAGRDEGPAAGAPSPLHEQNRAGTNATSIPATFLRVTVAV